MALPCTEGATGDDLVMSDFTSPFSLSHREIPLNPHIPFIPGFFFFCAPETPEREKMNKALCSSHVHPLQEREGGGFARVSDFCTDPSRAVGRIQVMDSGLSDPSVPL